MINGKTLPEVNDALFYRYGVKLDSTPEEIAASLAGYVEYST
jgi:hypothetical protein